MQRGLEKRLEALEAIEVAEQQAEAARPLDATDADELTDDEILAEACYGLRYADGHTVSLVVANGTFCPTSYWDRDFWLRVGERAWAITAAREICLVPMTEDEMQTAIAMIDAGSIIVRALPPQARPCHDSTITYVWAEHDMVYPIVMLLRYSLNAIVGQVLRGSPFEPLECAADVLAVLRRARAHEQIPDVWRAPAPERIITNLRGNSPSLVAPVAVESAPPIVVPVEPPVPPPPTLPDDDPAFIGNQKAIDEMLIARRNQKWGQGR
jgi:hypothetical protein